MLIVHQGFPPDWLAELLKQPGGGGHFRIDVRHFGEGDPTPVEWLVRQHVLPLSLPLPLLMRVTDEAIFLRHLTRGEQPVHPSEIFWFLEEIAKRHHARLRPDGASLEAETGMPLTDNEARAMLDSL
ncbi:hypothetical protein Thpro_021697 [Acidihalobacter prosperus]|uniref:Uncharacterized protein n=1 Tax=Acidihalobacter prosperus TaxID=160660 RepID=A0A1A6C490_9GAMM|nr:hypothetical protein Thpro_021697 [Acidihalobacter prosperus]